MDLKAVAGEMYGRLRRVLMAALGRTQTSGDGDAGDILMDLSLATPRRQAEYLVERGLSTDLIESFTDRPLTTGDPRLAGRTEVIEKLASGIADWRSGRSMLLALTAPAGQGLTTVLNQISPLLEAGEVIVRLDLANRPAGLADCLALCPALFDLNSVPASLADAIALADTVPPRVIVVDNGHFLNARLMDGSTGIMAFGALMVATQGRHMWIFGCEQQAWRRQGYLYQAQHYFDQVIELPVFEHAELAEVIARRLTAAGYEYAPAEGEKSEAGTGLPESVSRTLHRLSGGHPGLTFFHLLRAMRVEDGRRYACEPMNAIDYTILRELSRTELLTLAEILAHGRLNAAEHLALFRLGEQESSLMLHHLLQTGLIAVEIDPQGGTRYRLQPLHVDAIRTHLIHANYLY